MRKRLVLLAGAIFFGAMFTIGLIILAGVPDRFAPPFPDMAVIGGALAMFATVGGFAIGFIEAATVE